VKSGTVSGEVKPVQGSGTVRIEGKKVVRDGDACTMNGGNNPGMYIAVVLPGSSLNERLIAASNPSAMHQGIVRFKAWLKKMSFNIGEAVRHPVEGIDGAARGMANIPSHLAEFFLKVVAEQRATELNNAANIQRIFGQTEASKNLEDVASTSRQLVDKIDLPKFSLKNAAQQGGDAISTALQIFAVAPGIIKSTVRSSKSIVEAASEIRATEAVFKSIEKIPPNAEFVRARGISTSGNTNNTFSLALHHDDGVKILSRGRGSDAFHATPNDRNQISSILKGIDPKYLNPDSRFGKAFYVAEEPGTTLAELMHHGIHPTHAIRFSMNSDAMRVLDLTNPNVAAKYGYTGGPITSQTQAIGGAARRDGFNVIRFYSERDIGKINNAVLEDFNEILKPQIVTPVEK